MRAFCYTKKGRVVTFFELFAMGMLMFRLLVQHTFAIDPYLKGHESVVVSVTMTYAAIIWGIACAVLCTTGGVPSLVAHYFFRVSPENIAVFKKHMADVSKRQPARQRSCSNGRCD